ncbi:MAG: hypothetical protein AAGF23_20800 [Acidobacteriota bacterium]
MPDFLRPSLLRLITHLGIAAALAAPAAARDGVLRDGAVLGKVEAEGGVTIYRIYSAPRPAVARGGVAPVFTGGLYSFSHQLGAIIDGLVKCSDLHQVEKE